MFNRLIDRIWKRKKSVYRRRRTPAVSDDLTTQQRRLEDLIKDMGRDKPQLCGLLTHMYDKRWEFADIFSAHRILEDNLFYKHTEPPEEAINLVHSAIETGAVRQEYVIERIMPIEQLRMVAEAVGRAVGSGAPLYLYTDIWGRWQGNKEDRLNSRMFAKDLKESVSGLETVGSLTKKAKAFFMKKIDRIISSSYITYGEKVGNIGKALLAAGESTPAVAYDLCNRFHEKDISDEFTHMYKALLRLSSSTPANVFSFISRAIEYIDVSHNGVVNKGYVDALSKLVFKISLLIPENWEAEKKYTPSDVAGIFSPQFTRDRAERYINGYSSLLEDLLKGENRKIQLRIEDVKKLLPRFQDAIFDTNLCILDCTKRLRALDEECLAREGVSKRLEEYFETLITPLRGQSSPYSSLDLIVFADSHMKSISGEELAPHEQRMYDDMVMYAFKENGKRRDDRNRLVKIIEDRENWKPVPAHVRQFYSDWGIEVDEYMLDIGRDNNAWYRWNESTTSYMDLNAESLGEDRVDRNLVSTLVTDMMRRSRIIKAPNLAIWGLACGDAWPEIALSKELARWRVSSDSNERFNVWMYLYDINDTMVNRAARNCNREMISATIRRKDVRKITYDDIAYLQRQLIITLFGRTYFNLETESDTLIDSLYDICYEHYARGNKSPTIILMEGAYESNMKYYWDRRAEEMHVLYFLNRLETEREVICYDPSSTFPVKIPSTPVSPVAYSTYAPVQTPEKDKVEFYFATLRPASVLKGRFNLRQNQLVRCGESRVISKALIDSFRTRFHCGLIRSEDDPNTVVIQLVPDYRKLAEHIRTGYQRRGT
ncbi:hypothetical protein JW898_00435 [Candidatus Woesearchaeota archaeon]|nr:hypothetical protein [Candidatus Woesearchaeota archaeon]